MQSGLKAWALVFGMGTSFAATPVSVMKSPQAVVPFAFVVADRTLPAGKYSVSQLKNEPIFEVINEKGNSIFVRLSAQKQAHADHASLTFVCHGGACVLAKIIPPDSQIAYGLGQSAGTSSTVSVKLNPQ